VESVAMEALHPFFLLVDPYPICESLWLALHILGSSEVLKRLAEPLLPARSCCIENASLAYSFDSQSLATASFPARALLWLL
jgi:hypothetical protein